MPAGTRPPTALVVAVLIGAASIIVYSGSLGGAFLDFDDSLYVVGNGELRLPFPDAVASIFGTARGATWNPLQRLVYWVLWNASGGAPGPFRALNLVLHATACWLVFLVVREWLSRTGPAVATALLFAVHPSNVENVAWITEMKTLLAAVFGFAAVLMWQRAARGWRPGRWVCLVLFVLSLLSKTCFIFLPALLFLLDWSREGKPAFRRYLPFAVPVVAFAVVQILAASQPTVAPTADGIPALHGGSVPNHVMTILAVIPRYLLGVVWPFGQACRQVYPDVVSPADARLWVGVVLLVVGGVAVARSARAGRRRVAVAVPWFVLTLLPVLVIPIPIVYAERFLYLGMPFLVAVAMDALMRGGRVRLFLSRAAVGALVLFFAVPAVLYAATWSDSVSLWERAVRENEDDFWAWYCLGNALRTAGDDRAAVSVLREASARCPESRAVRQALARAEAAVGRPEEGVRILTEIVDADPHLGSAWADLAMIRSGQGDEEAAALVFREGLKRNPEDAHLWKTLGKFHLNHGRPVKGAKSLERAAECDPGDPETWRILAKVYRSVGLSEEAARCNAGLEQARR